MKNIIKALAILGTISDDYLDSDFNMIMDPEVNDCLIKMYFFMMISEGHPDKVKIVYIMNFCLPIII